MTIRTITTEDYDRLIRLWTETEGMGLRNLDDSREGMERFVRRNPGTSFLCMEGDRIIAALLCGHDGRRGYIYHATVDRDFRGRGIGRILVERAMEALRSEGIHKSALVVYKNNSPGNGFWEAIGFRERTDLVYRDLSLNPDNG